MKQNEKNGTNLKSVVKTLGILKLFSHGKSIWTINQMAEKIGYHKSSVQRIISTLETEGFLSRVADGKGVYRLGPEILFLGNLAEMGSDLRSIARPVMTRLVDKVQETSYLCIVDNYQCLYVERIECSQPIRIMHTVGKRNPMHCTGVGKALLSGMTLDEIDRVIAEKGLTRYALNTITDRQRLLEELETIRKTGISFDNEELDVGVMCIAAPIFDRFGKILASVSISGPTQRFVPGRIPFFKTEVKGVGNEISRMLGFSGSK